MTAAAGVDALDGWDDPDDPEVAARIEREIGGRRLTTDGPVPADEHDDELLPPSWAAGFGDDGAGPTDAVEVELDPSLEPVDLGPVLDGTGRQPVPDVMRRDDGASLLYSAAVNGLHGDSGAGKGWAVAFTIVQNTRQARRTLLLDFEDTAASIVARLLALGLLPHEIVTWLVYVRPEVPLGPAAVAHLCRLVATHAVELAVIDSVGEAFALEAIDENKDVEVGPWYRRVARPLAETGAAVLLVDHGTKAADNPLHPSGSKRKRAAITGASYLVEAIEPFVKGAGGRLRLTCAKDRHGNYRRGQAVGDLVMDSNSEGVRLTLYAPSARVQDDATVPTILAARAAVAAVQTEGRTVSQNELVGLMQIRASAQVKRGGIDYAASAGALVESAGPRRARLFTYAHDLEEPVDA